jgi:hypothetical protein
LEPIHPLSEVENFPHFLVAQLELYWVLRRIFSIGSLSRGVDGDFKILRLAARE